MENPGIQAILEQLYQEASQPREHKRTPAEIRGLIEGSTYWIERANEDREIQLRHWYEQGINE